MIELKCNKDKVGIKNIGLYYLRISVVLIVLATLIFSGVDIKWESGSILPSISISPEKTYGTTLDYQVNASGDDGVNFTGGWGFDSGTGGLVTIGYSGGYDFGSMSTFFRFTGINLPAGAVVTAATIQLYGITGYSLGQSGTPVMVVRGIKEASPAAPTTAAEFVTDTGLTTTATVGWTAAFTPVGNWYTSPSLTTIISELLTAYGAYSSGVMMFQVNNSGTTRRYNTINDYDYGTTEAAKLHIEYTLVSSPTVVTGSASSITATTVSLAGNVTNTGGANVIAWGTQYGFNTSYGTNTTNAGNQSSAFNWTDNLTSLLAGTTYHYRSYATNSQGTSFGSDSSFTTTSDPQIVTSSTTSVNETSATLSTNITIASQNCTTVVFLWDTNSGIPYANSYSLNGSFGVSQQTHAITSGLSPGTRYYASSNTTSPLGSFAGGEVSFVTTPYGVSASSATSNTSSSITVAYTAGTGGNWFNIRYSTTSYPSSSNGTSFYTGSDVSKQITGLSPSTYYYISIFSYASQGGIVSGVASTVGYVYETTAISTANMVVVGSLTVNPSLEAISVYLNFTGDSNNNSSAIVQWRVNGTSTWKNGMTMIKDTRAQVYHEEDDMSLIANAWANQFRAVILLPLSVLNSGGTGWVATSLVANTLYDVQVIVSDTDGVDGTNPIGSSCTTWDTNPASSGSTYYVSVNGSAGNPGTYASPWTLAKAISTVNAGDTVEILAGTYTGQFTFTRSGTVTNYITWRAYDYANPPVITYSTAEQGTLVINGASYNRFKGLSVAHTGSAYVFIIQGTSVRNITENCTFHINGGGEKNVGVRIASNTVSETIVRNNDFYTTAVGNDGGPFCLNLDYSHASGTVFCDNHVHSASSDVNFGDSIHNGLYKDGYAYRNTIDGSNDDGLEIENQGVNCAVWNNIITNCLASAIAVAPVTVGPLYIVRNVIVYDCLDRTGGSAGVKEGYSSDGFVFFYNNTFAYYSESTFTDSADSPTRHHYNVVYRNNIIYNTSGSYVIQYNGFGDGDWDYDLFYNGGASSATSIKWFGSQHSWNWMMANVPTFEPHGLWGNPLLATITGNVSLTATSPARNIGVIILGINDADSPWPYVNAAPDLGALEYGTSGVSVPTVTTNSVVVTGTSANVSFTITSTENASLYVFYDTDLSAPYSSNSTTAGTYASGNYSINIAGLNKGDKYVFVASANNTGGFGYGGALYGMTKPDGASSFAVTGHGSDWVSGNWTFGTGAIIAEVRGLSGVTAPTDNTSGTLYYWGTGTSTTFSGLSASANYSFTIFSHALEDSTYTDASSNSSFTQQTDAPPTLPSISVSVATLITTATARLNGNVDGIGGGDNVTVYVYWGLTNGSDNASLWSNNSTPTSPAQPQGVTSFYLYVTGLSAGTTYFYNVSANNSGGTSWGTASSFITLPAAPTGVSASDGGSTSGVTVNWTITAGATGYWIYRDGVLAGTTGNVSTYDDTDADAATITAGPVIALDGSSSSNVSLTVYGVAAYNGTSHTYYVIAGNASGNGDASSNDTGYRGHGTLTYQWYRSAGDSASTYSSMAGFTSSTGYDTTTPAPTITAGSAVASDGSSTSDIATNLSGATTNNGDGRYYYCAVSATGATTQSSGVDRGYTGAGSLTYQWQRSAGDSDAAYSNIVGATLSTYTDNATPAGSITPGMASASDNTSHYHVTLSLAGESTTNGAGRYYKCVLNASGCIEQTSASNRGYKGVGTLAYQWQRSAADADAAYSDIAGATTDPYNDISAPSDGSGRYYKAVLNADGVTQSTSTADRGYIDITVPASIEQETPVNRLNSVMLLALLAVLIFVIISIMVNSGNIIVAIILGAIAIYIINSFIQGLASLL